MDLHPLVIHFPIALLSLYSGLEIVRFFTKAPYWTRVRGVLVITGALGATAALFTGETAERAFGSAEFRPVLELHSLLGNVVTWLYGTLAVSYLLLWLRDAGAGRQLSGGVGSVFAFLARVASLIAETPLAPLLAIAGFACLGLVGALGAILVYGPEFDPVTSVVYGLFF